MIDILLLLIPMAMLDSLNPLTIVTQIFLLTTKKPLQRALGHAIGVFSMYFIGGLLIIMGIRQIQKPLLDLAQSYEITLIGYVIELIIGLLTIYFGYRISKKKDGWNKIFIKKAGSLNFFESIFLGCLTTLGDLTTAIPYFAAIALVVKAKIAFLQIIFLLLAYNIIYVFPLIILLSLLLMKNSVLLFSKVGAFIEKWSKKILVMTCVVFGILLIFDSIGRFLAHPLF